MHVRSGEKVATFDLVSHPEETLKRKGIQLIFEDFLVEEQPVMLEVHITDGFQFPVLVGQIQMENEGKSVSPGGLIPKRMAFKRRLYFDLTEALGRLRGARRVEVVLRAYDVQGKEERTAHFKPGHLSLVIPDA